MCFRVFFFWLLISLNDRKTKFLAEILRSMIFLHLTDKSESKKDLLSFNRLLVTFYLVDFITDHLKNV